MSKILPLNTKLNLSIRCVPTQDARDALATFVTVIHAGDALATGVTVIHFYAILINP